MSDDAVMAQRRWLVAHQNAELYGADRIVAEVADILRRRGEVLVLLPLDGPLVDALEARGIPTRIVPEIFVVRKSTLNPSAWPRAVQDFLRSVRVLRRLIGQWRPTDVYVNTITIPSVIVAGRSKRLPVTVHVHEAETQMPPLVQRGLLAPLLLSTRLVAISEAVSHFLISNWRVLRGRVVIVRNPVRAPQPAFPELPGERPATLQVLTPGRWSPRKGTDLVIGACAQARRRGVRLQLTLLGSVYDGYEWYERQILEQASAALPDTTFVPFATDPDPVWRTAHVTVVPSRVEPYGMVAAESLLRGRVTIASGVDGLPEIIEPGKTGWLVPPSVDGLADAIVAVWEDWGHAASMARRGCETAAAWTPESFEARLVEVLGLRAEG